MRVEKVSFGSCAVEKKDGRVVDDHVVVGNTGSLVLLGDLAESVEEEPITKFHDVRLVHTSDFLDPVFESQHIS